jgi:Ser-tRNA(Ala) deacylase AlaX
MTTQLLYLHDTFCFNSEAVITAKGRDDRGAFVILDRSVFYPQGGGQMADRGYLINTCSDQEHEIPVTFVGFRDGDVVHYISDQYYEAIEPGRSLNLIVDSGHRIQNAKLHTAGHLVSHVLEAISPRLVPIKGYHFNNGSYVEFVNSESISINELLEQANAWIQEVIAKDYEIHQSFSDFKGIEKVRPHLAPLVPKDKPSRIVAIGDFTPLPCGGTHLMKLSQIGSARVTKTKRVKENTRVSYEVT